MSILENPIPNEVLDNATSPLTDDRAAYKDSTYEIVSKVAYLIGVPKRIFDNEHEAPKVEVYNRLDSDKTARIIRHLCIVRTAIERNFKRINERMRFQYETILSMPEYVPQESINQLSLDGVNFIKNTSKKLYQRTLVDALKKYKRGLSSSLFDEISKSGCPTVSFADGFRLLQNNTFSRDDLSYDVGDVRNIHYGDVLIKYGTVTDIGALSVPCIKPDRDIEKFSSSSYLRNGDIVFADTAEDYTVGKATEIVGVTNQRVLSGLHTIPCRPHDRFAPMFLGHYFNSYHFRRQIYRMIQGIKVSSISKSEIAKTTILTPPYDVQRKVASVLSEVDHLIEKEAETVIVLQKIRRGLLQQLFI